jgi:hypothetical protein
MQSFDTIQRVRGMHHSGNYKTVIPAGWLPSVKERMLPLFGVRQDKVGTALSLLVPNFLSPLKFELQSRRSDLLGTSFLIQQSFSSTFCNSAFLIGMVIINVK